MSSEYTDLEIEKSIPQRDLKRIFNKDIYRALEPDEWIQVLTSSTDTRVVKLLESMLDPAYRRYSFARLCQLAGLSLKDIIHLLREYHLSTGMVRMVGYVPRILEDTAIDATASMQCCPKCDGKGEIMDYEDQEKRICPVCDGKKKVRAPGDKDKLSIITEIMGLTGKKGPMVALQQNFNNNQGNPADYKTLVTVSEKQEE